MPRIKSFQDVSLRMFPEIIGVWDMKIRREISPECGQHCPINWGSRWSKSWNKEEVQTDAKLILKCLHRLL